jgi:hypothetical protein
MKPTRQRLDESLKAVEGTAEPAAETKPPPAETKPPPAETKQPPTETKPKPVKKPTLARFLGIE